RRRPRGDARVHPRRREARHVRSVQRRPPRVRGGDERRVPDMSDHPPALHHLPPQECFPDVWVARSAIGMSIPLGLKITFSRNMVAVRTPEGWVLLNPVRLTESAEA